MKQIKIGLLWHSANSGNLGVGALTVGNMALAREAAADIGLEAVFTIFGPDDRDPCYIHGVEVFPLTARTMLDPRCFARAVAPLDCVLDISSGDSFTDIYPLKRFGWIVLTKAIVVMQGVPLVFSPQTIGPFAGATVAKRALGRLARWTMRRARAVTVRDGRSFDAVRVLVPGIEPVMSAEVAFALPWTPAAHLAAVSPASAGQRWRIGLNVSGLLWRGGYTGRGEFNLGYDYKALMIAVIESLLAAGTYRIELFCHVVGTGVLVDNGDGDGDSGVADELALRYPALVRVADFASPSAAKSYISGLDLVIAARMHACIAAFSSGVPVVPVSYSRKFEGLFDSLGYARVVPYTGMTTADAHAFIMHAVGQRDEMKAEVAAGLTCIEPRLDAYRHVLREVFGEIKKAKEG